MTIIDRISAALPRKFLFIFLALMIVMTFGIPTRAKDRELKVPAAFRDKLYDAQFISPTEVFVVGYPGLILHSTDAGVTWKRLILHESEPFFAIDFADEKHGWIVGRSGLIFATVDGGKTWNQQESGIKEGLYDVDFIDAQRGMAVGNFGTILRTDDGGTTWNATVLEMMQSAAINGLQMRDSQTAFVVGEYPIWETELAEEITTEDISSMWRTDDGGETWSRVGGVMPKTLYFIHFVNDQAGFAGGIAGTLGKTEDGGETWKTLATPHDNLLVNIAQMGNDLFIAGTEGVVLKVRGDSVAKLDTKLFTWLCGIDFGDKDHGVLVGARGTVMYTADGGKTWTKHPIK